MTLNLHKFLVVALCCCSIPNMYAPSSEHGLGFLQRVRNNSEYPIDFSQEKTILDYLPDGTVIRIKSLRKEYGTQGRYYAVRKLVGAYRLEADTLDANDPATHFVVKRFVSRDFSEYMGLYSDYAEGQFMKTDDSRAVTFSMADIMDDKAAQGHWTVVDISGEVGAKLDDKKFMDPVFAANIFNACYIKSRVSGFMQSRGTPQNYPGLEKEPVNKYANPILQGTESSTEPAKNNGSANSATPQQTAALQVAAPESGSAPTTEATQPKAALTTAVGTPTQITADRAINAQFIDSSTAIIIKQNGSVAQQQNDGAWTILNQGLSGAAFTSLAPGDDGTLWGSDINNNVWSFDLQTNTWSKVTTLPAVSSIAKISLGNASNIWILSGDGILFQRIQEGESVSWKNPDQAIGTGAIKDFCVTPDGTVFVLSSDNKIYRGTKTGAGYAFSPFCSPSELIGTPAIALAAGSKSFVAFSAPNNEIYVLVTGKPGNTKDSWKKLTLKDEKTAIKLRSFSAYKNNSIVGTTHNSGGADDYSVVLVSDITTT